MKIQIWANCSEFCDAYEPPRLRLETEDAVGAIKEAASIGDQLHWVEVVVVKECDHSCDRDHESTCDPNECPSFTGVCLLCR
jgi:hypothetical protein